MGTIDNNDKYNYYYKCIKKSINNKSVLFYSHDGNDFAGNLYRIAEEISKKEYGINRLYIVLKPKVEIPNNIVRLLRKIGKRITILYYDSYEYYEALARTKYLFTDNNMPYHFYKRNNQILVQVWHGTPLKLLGYDNIYDVSFVGNARRAFTTADYILFPNQYMSEKMIQSFRMSVELCENNKFVYEGYPRNNIFYREEINEKIIKDKGLIGKKIFVYMPTWRGTLNQKKNNIHSIQKYLSELDNKMDDDMILYIKLHRLDMMRIHFSDYKKIVPFPEDEYETYEFLSIADCLITDYSSVMFDFLCTRKKIILFTYDLEEYKSNHGFYFDLNELPFPKVNTVCELFEEMKTEKNYLDNDVVQKFIPYDCKQSLSRFCRLVFDRENNVSQYYKYESNNKKNILLYCGALNCDAATMNFYKYLDSCDFKETNYVFLYTNTSFINNPLRLQGIPREIDIASIDMIDGDVYFLGKDTYTKQDYNTCFKRLFPYISFNKIIRFGGIDTNSLYLLGNVNISEKIFLYYPAMELDNRFVKFERESYNARIRFIHIPELIDNEEQYIVPSRDMIDEKNFYNLDDIFLTINEYIELSEEKPQKYPKRFIAKTNDIKTYEVQEMNKTIYSLRKENEVLNIQKELLIDAYNKIYESTSWKITYPIRKILDKIKSHIN